MGRQRIGLHPAARDAISVLGQQVRLSRVAKRWTVAELARAAGVSTYVVTAIENGAPSVSIGNVLNVAAIVGVPLFGVEDRAELALMRRRGEERIALLPRRVNSSRTETDDDGLDF